MFRLKLIDRLQGAEITIDKFSTHQQAEDRANRMELIKPINTAYNTVYWVIEED